MRSLNEPAGMTQTETDTTQRPRLMRFSDLLTEMRPEAEAAHEAWKTGTPRGAISGLKSLDNELNGAFSNGLHMLHGNTGTGKTAIVLQIAASCQCPAIFVTCEMSPAEILRRHTARITGTYLQRLKTGELSADAFEKLARQGAEAAPDLALIDGTRAPAMPKYLQECGNAIRRGSKLLIVIDSLHTWTQSIAPEGAKEYESLNIAIRSLQSLAASLECPILLTSERNRDSMNSGGVNAGAGSRKIEYQGETIIQLDRKADEKPDAEGLVDVTLRLVKNRHGAAGKPLALRFHGAKQEFTDTEGKW